jgi:hypothetical protein
VAPHTTSLGASAHRQSLRHHLAQLQAADALYIVRESVDLEFELAAYLCLLPSDRAVLFDAVRGHSTKVVANLLTSREPDRVQPWRGPAAGCPRARAPPPRRAPMNVQAVPDGARIAVPAALVYSSAP